MLRAVKRRLYPNKEQATMINKLLGCYRFVYNQTLARKIKSYKETKTTNNNSSKYDEIRKIKELLDMGAITQEEFEIEKRKLLSN